MRPVYHPAYVASRKMFGNSMTLASILLLMLCVGHASGAALCATSGQGSLNLRNKGVSNCAICPPPTFDSVSNFDIIKYVAAPWYPQKQVEVPYQPANSLYCVRAKYTLLNESNPADGILVQNYANVGKVNGPPQGTSDSDGGHNDTRLIAVPAFNATGPTAASKLLVGPAAVYNLPGDVWKSTFGPYWVVAVGPSSNETLGYDWAIITGGQPVTATPNGACRTGGPGPQAAQYYGGFWLFSRQPVDPAATAVMEDKARSLGLDTSLLLPVQQQGCLYQGA